MHTLRLLRKRPCYALTTSQAHLDFSRRGNPSFAHRFLLASIDQAAAVATGEDPARRIQESNPAAAVPAIGVSLTPKPRSASAKCARRPCDRDALRYRRSVLSWPTPRSEHQIDGVSFGENRYPFRGPPIPGQSVQEALSRAQPAFAMPTADIDRHAAFGRLSASSAPGRPPMTPVMAALSAWASARPASMAKG